MRAYSILLTGLTFFVFFEITAQPSFTASSQSVNTTGTNATVRREQKVVVITGVRFAYPLVQKWIDDYNTVNPDVQIIIESRGTSDPSAYDILIEAYEPEAAQNKVRQYTYLARYAILPVANSGSEFAKIYSQKGLHQELIKQLFFHDIFSDKKEQTNIKVPYTIYLLPFQNTLAISKKISREKQLPVPMNIS
jgi:ABC-type phosphate transport system substrate-binding protein